MRHVCALNNPQTKIIFSKKSERKLPPKFTFDSVEGPPKFHEGTKNAPPTSKNSEGKSQTLSNSIRDKLENRK